MNRKAYLKCSQTGRASLLFHSVLLLASLTAAWTCLPLAAMGDQGDHYQKTNLVSDLPDVALLQDTNLVNAWGMSFSSGSPVWVSDNGTGLATLYAVTNDSAGVLHVVKQGLQVAIPGEGTPTGQVFNNTGGFRGDIFLFASEDGTISGWRNALGTNAEMLVPGSDASVYKGITLSSNNLGPVLLAANFRNRTVDEFDTNSTLIGQFMDAAAPTGYAPFNVQSLEGMVFVTFAKQDAAKHDDVAGAGHGLIDLFDPQSGMFHRFATGSKAGGKLHAINSPWGLAIAPDTFGKHAGRLLVGNFGKGTIMAFEPNGKFDGLLEGAHEKPLVIDGLWGLAFGNGVRAATPDELLFTAGPDGESHGLLGMITPLAGKHHGDGDHDRH
jgi:uncharacterized protein (TIGR03118 family)